MVKGFMYFALFVFVCSCTTTRKFDFSSAYKFRYLRYDRVNKPDSVPPLLASADRHMLAPSVGSTVIPEVKFKEKTFPPLKNTRSVKSKHGRKVPVILNNSFTAHRYSAGKTAVIPFKTYDVKG